MNATPPPLPSKATPPPLPFANPQCASLGQWIGHYILKRRQFLLGMSLSLAITAAVVFGLAASLADVLYTVPPWLRGLGLTGAIGLVLWIGFTGLRRALTLGRRRALDEIEAIIPAQGQMIRTALETADAPPAQDPVRALLRDGLAAQAHHLTRRFEPVRHLPWRQLWVRSMAAAGLAVIALILVAAWPDLRTAVRRFLQPAAGITFTRVELLHPPREIVAGNECTLTVQVRGRQAPPPTLTVRHGDRLEAPVPMNPDPAVPGRFHLSLGKPGASVAVRGFAGDGMTDEFPITVVYPPKVKEITATLTYPEYTRLQPATQHSPDIEAVEGTRVTVTIATDRPLRSGQVEFSDGSTAPFTLQGETTTFAATLNRGALTWRLAARDDSGLSPPAAGGKWIGREDKPPKIQWVTPKGDMEATPLAEVTLRAKATDDFGLVETGLVIQAGGKERVLITQDYPGADGFPASAVVEALAELERENLTIRDNVKAYAFARDSFPAPAGRERRGVSDLLNIDIRQFKVWRAIGGGGGGPPMPAAQQALLKLEQAIKRQRAIVNTAFRFKEEAIRESAAARETATAQRRLATGAEELRSALEASEAPPAADDLLLLDTAVGQMLGAADALDALEIPIAWANADGALTSLLELRREFMKLMSRDGQPGNPDPQPDNFQLPTMTELAQEAERLAKEEADIAQAVPPAKDSSVEIDQLAARQAAARSDAGELFDRIVTHPEITDLAQSRMGQAEKSMAEAGHELRARQPDASISPLQAAQSSLSHLARHLRGLDASQAAATLRQASDLANQSAEALKQHDDSGTGDDGAANEGSKEASAGPPPAGGSGSQPAENAATINDWLKHLARNESLGRTAERIGSLQRESGIEEIAKNLASRPEDESADQPTQTAADQAMAAQLESLARSLDAEHQRLVQGTLEKLTAAQAAAQAQRAAQSPGRESADTPSPTPGQSDQTTGDGEAPSAANRGPANSTTGPGRGPRQPHAFSTAPPGSPRFTQDLADLLKELGDPQLNELADALIRDLLPSSYNSNVDADTLGTIETRLDALIQDVIQRQLLAGKSDRVPPEFESRVENYFRRLSEDTGEDEEGESDDEADSPPPETPPRRALNDDLSAPSLNQPPAEGAGEGASLFDAPPRPRILDQ
ncbi:MAG: hypothetical protein ACKV19_13325 [Verrucomicrobiales bacterium]